MGIWDDLYARATAQRQGEVPTGILGPAGGIYAPAGYGSSLPSIGDIYASLMTPVSSALSSRGAPQGATYTPQEGDADFRGPPRPTAPAGAAASAIPQSQAVGGGEPGGGLGTSFKGNFTDPESQRLIEMLRAAREKARQGQQAGVEQAQRQFGAYANLPTQLDLTPLMALADQWSGSNLAKAYNRPVSTEERVNALSALQNAVQKQQSGLTETEMAALNQELMDKYRSNELALRAKEIEAHRQANNIAKQQVDQFKQDKEDQRMREALQKYEKPIRGSISLDKSLGDLQKFVQQNGLALGKENLRKEYTRLYNRVKLDVKNVEELGAITNSDVNITGGMIGPETTAEGFLAQIRGLDPTALASSLQGFRDANKAAFQLGMGSLRLTFPSGATAPQLDNWEKSFGGAARSAASPQTTVTKEQLDSMTPEQIEALYNAK